MATKTRPTVPRRPPAPVRPALGHLMPATALTARAGRSGRKTLTLGEYIVEQVKAGVDPQNAAGLVGVTAPEFQAWMRDGSLGRARLDAGADWARDFTPEQQDTVLFVDQVVRAHSVQIAGLSRTAELAALGELPPTVTTIVKRDDKGKVTEWTERTESVAPDLQTLRWKLAQLEPTVYGNKSSVSVTVVDMTDTEATVDIVEARFRDVAAALAAKMTKAIETTSTEVPSNGEPDGQQQHPGPDT